MFTTTQVLLITLLALYKYGILSVLAADDYYKLMYSLGEDKRGYVFDKEKRPRYDFGIGKRSLDSNRQKMYAFGLGKRNPLVSSDYDRFIDDLIPYSEDNPDLNKEQGVQEKEKRRQYDFGLGKRTPSKMYAFGLGKRNTLTPNDYDNFIEDLIPLSEIGQGVEKDKQEAYYDDKEKRRQYDFGIGKRESGHKMYAFGLGKRNPQSSEDYDVFDFEPRDDYSKRLQPYGFGLGKRAAPAPYNFGLGKRLTNEYGISQRSQRYNFGLGKRSYIDDDDIDENQYRKFLNAKRSRYNFGLGKRNADPEGFGYVVPSNQHDLYTRANQKFNFGLGKREVSKEELQQLDETSPTSAATSTSGMQRLNSLEETDNLLAHQHSSKTKKRETPSSSVDNYALQEISIKH